MGKTAYRGPLYGAKAVIAKFAAGTTSTGASSALIASFIVPSYEDWMLTEVSAYCSTCSSGGNTVAIKTEGGSTTGIQRPDGVSTRAATLATLTWGTSTTGPLLTTVTADAGEYEGSWIPAGSTVRIVGSSIANAISNLNVTLRGYTRYVDSTRAV